MCLCHLAEKESQVQGCAVLLGPEDRVPTQGRILRQGPLGLGTLRGQMPGGDRSTRRARIPALAWGWQRIPGWIEGPRCRGNRHRRAQAAGAPRTPFWYIRSLDLPAQTWKKQYPTTLQVLQEAQGEAAASPARVVAPGCDSRDRGAPELRFPEGSVGRGGRLGAAPGGRVCVCREHGPPRGRRSAGASPSPGAHGPSLSPEAARAAAQQPRLRLARLSLPSLPRLGSRVRRPAARGRRALRSRTGAGGGGRVRGGRAVQRRAETRPPRRSLARSLAGSPPPALRSLPPLPGVIDPSRAPPPPRPF